MKRILAIQGNFEDTNMSVQNNLQEKANKISSEMRAELTERVIPFWAALADYENGGFYGKVGYDLAVDKTADKGAILHCRILWFFSKCYTELQDSECLKLAKHCYDFIVAHLYDDKFGGAYWSVKADGSVANSMKHGYCNAFLIYALSAYTEASGDMEAYKLALKVFDTVELEMVLACELGYRESFNRVWEATEKNGLSEDETGAVKNSNTILHLVEAYTALYKIRSNPNVAKKLVSLLELTYEHLYDKPERRLWAYFDAKMNPLGDVHSYGHDAEMIHVVAAALNAAKAVIPAELAANLSVMNYVFACELDRVAFADNGAMYYESVDGEVIRQRVWWAQTEAVLGFMEAYGRFREERFFERGAALWEYIKANFLDSRANSEWFNELDENEVPVEMPIASEWKCPYHNGRMLLAGLRLPELFS